MQMNFLCESRSCYMTYANAKGENKNKNRMHMYRLEKGESRKITGESAKNLKEVIYMMNC